jgi:hypothetical protein
VATAEQYADWIIKNADRRGTPEFETVAKAYQAAKAQAKPQQDFAFDPMRDMSMGERALAGVGKAFTDLGRGAGQLVRAVSREDVAESRKLDAPLMSTTAGTVGNIAGNIAMLAPTAMIPGANTISGGAAIGALSGLLQPSVSTSETLTNVSLGGGSGALVPAVVRGVKVARAAAEPFSAKGRDAIVGRTLNRVAGDDAPVVAQRLKAATAPFVGPSQGTPRTIMGEYVPGSIPTVGQAARSPAIAALERAATANSPEVTNAVSGAMANQNAARVGLLEDLAGTDGARLFASEMRDGTAQKLYDAAYRKGLPPFTPQQQAIVEDLLKRPAVKGGHMAPGALDDAKMLARNEGIDIADPAGSVKGLDYMKRALDDRIAKADGNERRILMGIKEKLVGLLDEASPEYAQARSTYAQMSRPINQMDVAQSIADKSVNKLTGNLQPAAYARALSDQTAAGATGLRTATLEGTMAPAQMNQLRSILLDVQRANAAQTVGRGVGSDTVQKLAYSNLMDESGVPTFLRNLGPAQVVGGVAGRMADAAYGRANRELGNRLAEVMLDPQAAAQLMYATSPKEANQLLQLIARATSGLAISAPASANAHQQ